MLVDGNVKVSFVPTIASTSAPTATELNAGTSLECLITADGFNLSVKEDTVAIPKLCDTTNSEAPGRATYSADITYVRKTVVAEDKAWTTLVRGTAGYLVVRYGTAASTAFTAADKVTIYPGKAGERRQEKPVANGAITFTGTWFTSAPPVFDAAVV
jgi:hypothetical protein